MMRRAILVVVAALALAVIAPAPSRTAAVAPEAPHYVLVDEGVREMLAQAWDDVHADQPERAFCLVYSVDSTWGDPVYRVRAAWPALVTASTPQSIVSHCPLGAGMTRLHTHPPATCGDPADCHLGGPLAYECFPSDVDRLTLRASGAPFAMVQCDRRALVPYWRQP